MSQSGYRGIVVPISGGLDSSVTAALCVRAMGAHRVTGLRLPERWGNPDAEKYGAMINGRQRARMLYSYKYAEENNLMVVGAANRTECAVGLFAKFGIDDAADLMPLKTLYRSDVLQLAKYLALPAEICERTPNPDMVPGVTDKYRSYLGISAAELDLILKGFDRRSKSTRIAKELGIDEQ